MKMKNLFAGLVATTIVASSASAFAAVPVGNIVETKDATTVSAALPAEGKSGQLTVIVVKLAKPADDAETVTVPADISDGDIYYIDQAEYTSDDMFANLKLKAGLKEGDYFMVRVGGENVKETGIAEAVYQIVADKPPVESKKYLYGDVDDTYGVQSTDALQVLYHAIGGDSVLDDGAKWRQVAANVKTVDDEGISSIDALQILYYAIGGDSVIDTLPEYFTID